MMNIKFFIYSFWYFFFFTSFDVRRPIQNRLSIMDFQQKSKMAAQITAVSLPKRGLSGTIFRDRNAQKIVYE